MRGRIVGLALAVILLTGCGRETERKLEATQQQLATASNELAAAHAETAQVKTQMQTKMDELQESVLKLTDEKADAEKKILSLKTEFEGIQLGLQQKLDEQQAKITAQEQEKATLTSQLAQVNQSLAELEKTHATTVAHLQAMREEFVKLTNAKEALEVKLHDLNALKEQIHVVKLELHEKKVEEWKRLDRAESAMGNHGYLFKEGAWVAPRTPGKYPLNQEIRFGE